MTAIVRAGQDGDGGEPVRWPWLDRPWPASLVAAVVTMTGVLGSLGTAIALQDLPGWSLQVPVLAVVLGLTAGRATMSDAHGRLEALIELPTLALAAAAAGWLLINLPLAGQAALVLGLTIGILARRYGSTVRRAGRLAALPFLALLITPVPVVSSAGPGHLLWAPVVAAIAVLWSTACSAAAHRAGLVPGAAAMAPPDAAATAPPPPATASPTTGPPAAAGPPTAAARASTATPASSASATAPPAATPRRRWDAPTRMAIQMAIGLSVAMAAGHALFGERWAWTVLSAFLVAHGNRGRGDVLHKAGLRMLGAVVGTLLATSVGGWVPPGGNSDLVLLFGVMLVALVLRSRSYAFWAAGVTAMVALLHGYLGSGGGAELLRERLLGVVAGSVIAVACAWFVLPVRTGDVLRRRIADCLAALTDDLADGADPTSPRFRQTLARVDELSATLRTHARLRLPSTGPRPFSAITALHELAPLPTPPDERRRLRIATVRVRRAMVGRDDPAAADLPPALATIHGVLQSLSRRA